MAIQDFNNVKQRLLLADGSFCDLYVSWLSMEHARSLMQTLLVEVPWAQREIEIYGRKVMQPRRVAWIGDPEAIYTYSRTRHVPLPWTATLSELRAALEDTVGTRFNSVLCNLYRDGNDSMGLHSDSEPELGPDPVVASISLGATRKFRLRHRSAGNGRRSAREQDTTALAHALDLDLTSGSLLVMAGATQRFYRHDVPKQAAVRDARINLTFRRVSPV